MAVAVAVAVAVVWLGFGRTDLQRIRLLAPEFLPTLEEKVRLLAASRHWNKAAAVCADDILGRDIYHLYFFME